MPKDPSIVLGISFAHGDSSAALIVDNTLCAAVEEERFNRVKHSSLFPSRAIAYCLSHAGIAPDQVHTVAIAKKPWNAFLRKAAFSMQHPSWIKSKLGTRPGQQRDNLAKSLAQLGINPRKIVRVEHHAAHMMSVNCMVNGEEDVALLSLDGMGDFVSLAIGTGSKNRIKIIGRVYFPHSLGYFYSEMTQYLGFLYFGDEFKVMGLSSYGEPRYLNAMRKLIREDSSLGFKLNLEAFPIFKHPNSFKIENGQPKICPTYNSNFLTQVIGVTARKPHEPLTEAHWNVAKSVQVRFEELANHTLGQLHDRVGGSTLALAGGCAHNSVWVGKIPECTEYKKIYVAPASTDAGTAVGAAIFANKKTVLPEGGHWALLGPSALDYVIEDSSLERSSIALSESMLSLDKVEFDFEVSSDSFESDEKLIAYLVKELANEKIIGLFYGRLEFGPRALGSRSILADPRPKSMRSRLNDRVKHREGFRPFAASVLWEYQDEWFENSFFAPTMEAVFKVRENKRSLIQSLVHADESCRIQSVTKEYQPFYYNLIDQFRKQTGIPMLINTSFNDSEPIVCSPQDAIRCFKSSDLDHLIIGHKVFSRCRERLAITA